MDVGFCGAKLHNRPGVVQDLYVYLVSSILKGRKITQQITIIILYVCYYTTHLNEQEVYL